MPRTTKILVNYTNFLRKDTIDKLSIIVIHNLPWISSANQTTINLEPLHSPKEYRKQHSEEET